MSQERDQNYNGQWLFSRYGSRLGFTLTYWHRLLYCLGRYRNYQRIDWKSVERLVFVCKGNICRSAYAETVARSLGLEAISCGLDTVEDAPANDGAIQWAQRKGFDLRTHRTRPMMYLILRKTDLLVAMEPWQARFLARNLSRKCQYTLLGAWSRPVLPHIHDPYGSSSAYFEKCFDYIENSVHEIVKKIGGASSD